MATTYPGQWIAVDGDRLIAHGSDAKPVFAEVDRAGVADALFVHLEPDDRLPEMENGANGERRQPGLGYLSPVPSRFRCPYRDQPIAKMR
jgi:hypothetical protein